MDVDVEILRTAVFEAWVSRLRDGRARAIIARRIDRIAESNLGDIKPVGQGVSELRINFGPGYRVYLTRRGRTIIVLLCGGDKDSQARDVARAKALSQEIETWS
ncbi:MAG: type II toxin-antitoxin system RelE/ParE family toxin [Caulobacterales bacterium]|nr:type II toxin-antitoxin system RelE/ParE family toxin [Caulobacterales bacterium]